MRGRAPRERPSQALLAPGGSSPVSESSPANSCSEALERELAARRQDAERYRQVEAARNPWQLGGGQVDRERRAGNSKQA